MSKKYLLPVKRAFEINFLTQLCRVKKYFYPRKCAVCRHCRQTVRAARVVGGQLGPGRFGRGGLPNPGGGGWVLAAKPPPRFFPPRSQTS